MKQLLEWSGMWTVLAGVLIGFVGMIVLIFTEDAWYLYALGWILGVVGVLVLFGSVLRDRLRARKTENLDDVGFN